MMSYKDFDYGRCYVTDPDVVDYIRECLGLSEGDIDKFVLDGRITPSVIVNPVGFFWVLSDNSPGPYVAGEIFYPHHNAIYTCYTDGEFAYEVSFEGFGWIEVAHLGGASPSVLRDLAIFGDVGGDQDSRFRCIADGELAFRGFLLKGLKLH